MHLAPPNPSGSRFPIGVLGWRVGVTATGNALELPSFLAQHHVPCRSLVAAGGKKLALPTSAGRVRGCRDTTVAYLDFSFSVASGRHDFPSFCCPLEGDLPSKRSFFFLLPSPPPRPPPLSSHFSLFLLPPAHPKSLGASGLSHQTRMGPQGGGRFPHAISTPVPASPPSRSHRGREGQ